MRDGSGVDADVWLLHVQLQRTGDPALLAALVEEYQSYASSLAHQLLRQSEPFEDIQQVAMEALVVSLRRFDVARRLPFPALARPTITGAIKRHYRDRGWSIRTPRPVHDIAPLLRDAEERLTAEMGHQPSRREVAEAIGVSEAEVRRTEEAIRNRAAVSLDQTGPDGGPGRGELLGALDAELEVAESLLDLREALDHLTVRDRTVLRLYYVEELSQRDIGARYGVSQMQISRWLANCMARIRRRVGDDAA